MSMKKKEWGAKEKYEPYPNKIQHFVEFWSLICIFKLDEMRGMQPKSVPASIPILRMTCHQVAKHFTNLVIFTNNVYIPVTSQESVIHCLLNPSVFPPIVWFRQQGPLLLNFVSPPHLKHPGTTQRNEVHDRLSWNNKKSQAGRFSKVRPTPSVSGRSYGQERWLLCVPYVSINFRRGATGKKRQSQCDAHQ